MKYILLLFTFVVLRYSAFKLRGEGGKVSRHKNQDEAQMCHKLFNSILSQEKWNVFCCLLQFSHFQMIATQLWRWEGRVKESVETWYYISFVFVEAVKSTWYLLYPLLKLGISMWWGNRWGQRFKWDEGLFYPSHGGMVNYFSSTISRRYKEVYGARASKHINSNS